MDRLARLEAEVEALRFEVQQLRQQVEEVADRTVGRHHPVETLLAQRGMSVLAHGDRTRILLPAGASSDQRRRFYDLMRRYSFRLFVRDLLQVPCGPDPGPLTRYCSPRTARGYLNALHDLGVVERPHQNGYQLVLQHISSFGPTLEWYVSEILQREFLAPALFSVRLKHTRHGGDFDVIALLEADLVYFEVKSSPPRGVELAAVSAFLERLEDLQPQLAIFLVDTELRMRDKIVELFREALAQRCSPAGGARWAVERLVDELFHIGHGVYLINSRKGIFTNLRRCIRDFRRRGTRLRLPWKAQLSASDTHP